MSLVLCPGMTFSSYQGPMPGLRIVMVLYVPHRLSFSLCSSESLIFDCFAALIEKDIVVLTASESQTYTALFLPWLQL